MILIVDDVYVNTVQQVFRNIVFYNDYVILASGLVNYFINFYQRVDLSSLIVTRGIVSGNYFCCTVVKIISDSFITTHRHFFHQVWNFINNLVTVGLISIGTERHLPLLAGLRYGGNTKHDLCNFVRLSCQIFSDCLKYFSQWQQVWSLWTQEAGDNGGVGGGLRNRI